jgi:hypothetical protein
VPLHLPDETSVGLLTCLVDELPLRKRRKMIATKTIISGPPTNSPSVNCHPRMTTMMIPSSKTRFVEANWKAIAALKSAPLRKRERASATAAYEQEDEVAPRPVPTAIDRGQPCAGGASLTA